MKDALKAGEDLLPHCDEDDKDLVKNKMDNIKSKYKELLRISGEKRDKVKEAKQLSDKFFNEKDDFMNWFDEMENKLSEAKVEGQEAEDEQAKLKVGRCYLHK
jgi:predicted  nucleic acid-binding Zn-ribbon protein